MSYEDCGSIGLAHMSNRGDRACCRAAKSSVRSDAIRECRRSDVAGWTKRRPKVAKTAPESGQNAFGRGQEHEMTPFDHQDDAI